MTDWALASLSETITAVRDGQARVRDIAEACLDRIERLDPTIAAFIAVDAEGLRRAADAADASLRNGRTARPLEGAVLAHKDMYHRADTIVSYGSRVPDAWTQTDTATVLSRLDEAGAIEAGRVVMVEFAMGPHGFNPNYPRCRNPWDLERIPCGSSSGSGAAVAARLVHGSLGSDTGGSIRGPATVNGVTGLVPTNGRVSRNGVMPMSFSLDAVGPLARTARDCALILSAIAGHDPKDATSFAHPVPDYEAALDSKGPLPRIGIARGYFDHGLDPRVRAAVGEAVAVLKHDGFPIVDVAMPVDLLNEIAELHPLVMKAEGAANHLDMMREKRAAYTPEVGLRLEAGFFIPATDYIRALKLRAVYLQRFQQAAFLQADVLLTPVMTIPTPTIAATTGKSGKAYLDMVVALTRNTKFVNYLGLPAMSVPCGFADNVPTAFQLVGQPFDEATLLRVADRYQRHTNWHRQVPSLWPKRQDKRAM